MNTLLISLTVFIVSIIFFILSFHKERRAFKHLKHLQKLKEGKGREKLLNRAEELAEQQFKKNLNKLSATLKDTTKSAMAENFNHLTQEIAYEKESLLQKAREDIENLKIAETKIIQQASRETVLAVARKMMLGKISILEDEKYILSVLDQFINDTRNH